MISPLIPDFEHTDTRTLQDQWLVLAQTLEQSLIESGATPGEDYTRLDLYKLTQPIIIEQIKNGELKL